MGVVGAQARLELISVFRFFIKTCTVEPTSALAAMVAATASPSLESYTMTPTSSVLSATSVTSTSSSIPDDTPDLHILIVEDNIINQTVLKRQIVKAGLTCDGEHQ